MHRSLEMATLAIGRLSCGDVGGLKTLITLIALETIKLLEDILEPTRSPINDLEAALYNILDEAN